MTKITIGITDCGRFANYENWFKEAGVIVVKLSAASQNISDVDRCDGIVLSGGEDVHPKYYGHPEWMERKEELKLDVNETRDAFEFQVIDRAVKQKKPILGICRGLQIANVYFKGTLIPDLPGDTRTQHSKNQGVDQKHEIRIEPGSCLQGIITPESRAVNSAHHQSADKIGEGLRVTATGKDGIVEALEWADPANKPFLLLVQWHPERMQDQSAPHSSQLRDHFLKSISRLK